MPLLGPHSHTKAVVGRFAVFIGVRGPPDRVGRMSVKGEEEDWTTNNKHQPFKLGLKTPIELCFSCFIQSTKKWCILRKTLEVTQTVWNTTLEEKMLIGCTNVTRPGSEEKKKIRPKRQCEVYRAGNKTGSHQLTDLNHMTPGGLLLADKLLIQHTITNLCTTQVNSELQLQCSNSIKIVYTLNKSEKVQNWKLYVINQHYLGSMCTGLISQSSWLLGLAGVVSSWKFSRVDMMSWTCRFSSLISCHNWDTITVTLKMNSEVSLLIRSVKFYLRRIWCHIYLCLR